MYNFRNQFFRTPTFPRTNHNMYINSKKNIGKYNNTYNTYNTYNPNPNPNTKPKPKSYSTETQNTNSNIFQLNTDKELFELFGIKIYLDDLLIICILLFLYQEGIQDEYLFISLILLLLS